jgi:hypothetical protein
LILTAPATMALAIQAGGFGAAETLNLLVCAAVPGSVWLMYWSRQAAHGPLDRARTW